MRVLAQVVPLYVSAFPSSSTAAQNVADTHETPLKTVEPSMLAGLHVADEPLAGSVDFSAFPASSTATQNVPLPHERPVRSLPPSTDFFMAHPVPLYVTTVPV